MMNVGCMTITWSNEQNLPSVLSDIKRAGYQGFETVDPLDRLGSAEQLAALAAENGLEVASIVLNAGLLGDENQVSEEITDCKRRIDYAQALGISVMMFVGGWNAGKILPSADYKRFATHLNRLTDYAHDRGITLAVHNHMDTLVERLDEIEHLFDLCSKATLLLDTAHLHMAGADSLDAIQRFTGRIAEVHLKDVFYPQRRESGVRWRPEWFVELGEGNCNLDFYAIIKNLIDKGYAGWWIVEMDRPREGRTPFESAQLSRGYLERTITKENRSVEPTREM